MMMLCRLCVAVVQMAVVPLAVAQFGLFMGLHVAAAAEVPEWSAGAARAKITPEEPIWMAGYASRTAPSEGHVHDLFAKALAVQDQTGNRLVIVTLDLIGISAELRSWLEERVQQEFQLPPSGLLMNASHTHCGPEFRTSKLKLYGVPEDQQDRCARYEEELRLKLLDLVGRSLKSLQPSRIGYTHGRAGFAMNRRLPTSSEPTNAPYPDGPVDHDVPVLRIESADGTLMALLFGYACHNTTLGFQKLCGDYAGFAQQDLEASLPGVTAMFLAGCGGDQNPQPRGSVELAEHHGASLASAVRAGLLGPIRPVGGKLKTVLETIPLSFAAVPDREELVLLSQNSNAWFGRRGKWLLDELDSRGALRSSCPATVQTICFGDELIMVALSGEVVVDYSLRLKREIPEGRLQGRAVWIAGYSNDVFGYVPSERVLREGGYEGGGAMRYTEFPGPFAPGIEAGIVDRVHQQVQTLTNVPK